MTCAKIPTIIFLEEINSSDEGRILTDMEKFSVKRPYTVLVGVILVIVLGVVSVTKMSTDLLPDITLPYVVVVTTYSGASPETVETVVSKPIESSMATVSNIESINSISNENYSMVVLEFTQTADMNAISLEIREKLDQLRSFWDDSVDNPIIMKLNPDMLPIMIAAVGVEGMNHTEVSDYVDKQVIPQIESIEGVASATASGLVEENIQVEISPRKIEKINQKIRASIDSKMKEQEDELKKGKEDIYKSQNKLNDAEKEIRNGQAEIDKNEENLSKGKEELKNQKDQMSAKLAESEKQLLTAKADLESAKVSLNTEIETIKQLDDARTQTETVKNNLNTCNKIDGTTGTDEIQKILPTLPTDIVVILQQYINGTLIWSDVESNPSWTAFKSSIPMQITALDSKLEELDTAISTKTNTLGAAKYLGVLDEQLVGINGQIAQIDQALLELSQGKLSASVEFSNANTKLEMGQYQIGSAKSQMDASKKQLEDGKKQLEDALSQIKDGEEQLEDAREDAYEQVDMTDTLTVDTVQSLLAAQNFSMPAGYVQDDDKTRYMVRIGDKPETLDEMKKLPLLNLHMDELDIITLEDVADVSYIDNSDDIYANVNGTAGVLLVIQKQTGYSTGDVSHKLEDRFSKMEEENPDLVLTPLMNQGIYIDLVMDSIISNVFWGALLAILILIIFLKDIKPTFVIACSIPVSLVTALVCMYFSGVTLNTISLSGLALGVGMLVDNSIVVIENIYRMRSEGHSMKEAAVEGAKEVSGAIIASTLTTVCVFLPIVFTEGITRQLFVDMGLTIAYSLMASLIIALTVVPAMSSKILTKTKNIKESKLYAASVNVYGKVLNRCLKIKPLIIIAVFLLLGISIFAANSRGTAFMPQMDSTQFNVTVELDEEDSFENTRKITDTLIDRILTIEEVEDVGAMAAGDLMPLASGGSSENENKTVIYVSTQVDKIRTNDEIAEDILAKAEGLNAKVTVDTSSMDMSAMGGKGINILVKGRDLDKLKSTANEVAAVLEGVEGVKDVSDGLENSTDELRIIVDKDKAMEHSLTVAQIYAQLQPKLAASKKSTVLSEEAKDYGVFVIHGGDAALNIDRLKLLTVEGTNESNETVDVPLSEIADFKKTKGISSIQRSEQSRYIQVSGAIADGYNIGLVSEEVQKKFSDFEVPVGCSLEFAGENETIRDTMDQLLLMLVLALVFMYLIMVAQFQSLLHPFIIMFTIPLAFTGGFLGLYFTGSEISVVAMIGFVMLSGIIVNNGIVLIDYINQLRAKGMEKKEAIITAGKTRLRPVLMTALTTILAMSTMVFSKKMGAEMSKPMAIVTVGGLLYGTLLTLIVIPCVYDLLTPLKKQKKKKQTEDKLLEENK